MPRHAEAVAIGVAGPVVGDRATLTNIAWDISCAEIAGCFAAPPVRLLNDLEAMATSVDVLSADETVVLQDGTPRHDGNTGVIAAGTGLGAAYLHRVDGRLHAVPTETGHADFAARTDDEIALVRMLRDEFGRAEIEHVLCGPGLVNLFRFTHDEVACDATAGVAAADLPAAISRAGLAGTCARCVKALSMFVSAYGAEAGNVALRGVTTAGLYVGGGIAPKILPALTDGRFIEAFCDKGPMTGLVSRMPVKVILNSEAGLLGAAVAAQELVGERDA
jgi:glucokinase